MVHTVFLYLALPWRRPDNPNAPIVGLMLTKDLIMLDPDDGEGWEPRVLSA